VLFSGIFLLIFGLFFPLDSPLKNFLPTPLAVASLTQPEGGEKISGGAKHLSSFLKLEVKNRRKSVEEAKA